VTLHYHFAPEVLRQPIEGDLMRVSARMHVTVVTAVAVGVVVLPTATAQAATVSATLVVSHSTAGWPVPSPDPAGITYDPGHKRLVLSDSEVEEMKLYKGTNVFYSTLGGAQTSGAVGWTTVPWSSEPTGISYLTAGRSLVTDDDADKVFLVNTDSNGRPKGTPRGFSTRPTNGDAEDVSLDSDATTNGHILVIDGTNTDVYDYSAGPNGIFDGVAPAGDDQRVAYDVGKYGALDPEGIKYYPGRNTILVLDSDSKKVYELSRTGALLNVIDISAAKPRHAAGITLAPASNGSGKTNLYICDRGIDNDSNPAENDGRFYEMSVKLPAR
jgi:hypothetical protein